jgi:hypothetical protein
MNEPRVSGLPEARKETARQKAQRVLGNNGDYWGQLVTTRATGDKGTTARSLFTGTIGGQELQISGHRVSGNIMEYLQNLLAKQTIT